MQVLRQLSRVFKNQFIIVRKRVYFYFHPGNHADAVFCLQAPSFNAEDTLAALAHFDAVVYPWAVHESGNVECYQPDLLPEALRDASDAAFEVRVILFLFSSGQSD